MNNDDHYESSFVPLVGVVEQVVDEQYVKVRVFGIHPLDRTLVTTEALPSCLVVYPIGGGQVSGGTLSHGLEVDAWVIGSWVDAPFYQQAIITGVFNGGDYGSSAYGSGGGEFVGQGSDGSSGTGGAGSDGGGDIDINATTNIPGDGNVQKVYNYVTTKLQAEGFSGDTHIQASAVCGVLMLEASVHIRPEIEGGYKGRAWGICQWLDPRRAKLFRKFGRTKRLDQQLDFMWWELGGDENRAKQLWLAARNLPDAVAGMCMFERAEEVDKRGVLHRSHGNFKTRLKYAYQVYNSIKQTGSAQTAAPRQAGV